MANPNAYSGNTFRPWYAGADSSEDIHIEAYDADVQTTLEHKSLFLSENLSTYKPLKNSNTYRGDRLSGNLEVKGRGAGESIESTAVKMEKLIITADTLSYTRIPIDYQDDWTAPDYRKQLATTSGTAHAKSYDTAHTIQLIKSADFIPPPTLAATFAPLSVNLSTLDFSGLSEEEAAESLVQGIKQAVNAFLIEKDITSDELVILVDPAWFSILLEHRKLMSVKYSHSASSDYAMRRVGYVAGVRIIESNVFPQGAIEGHELGADYDITADEATARAVLFHPKSVLVTVEAQALTSKEWDDEREMSYVLDSFRMYNVGQRRPDLVAVFREAA